MSAKFEKCATDSELRRIVFEFVKADKMTGVTSLSQIRTIERTRAELMTVARGLSNLIEALRDPFQSNAAKRLVRPEDQIRVDLDSTLNDCWQIGEALLAAKKKPKAVR